jgi:TolB-like protein
VKSDVAERTRRLSSYSKVAGLTSDEEVGIELATRQLPSIMILPFRNIGGGEQQATLADGFRLSIQSVMVKLSGLFLINAPAVEMFRDRDISAVEAGNEAGVRYVLEGATQIAGARIRVTVQLTDVPAARVVWSEQYDRVLDDIFELQDEITGEVVTTLGIEFSTPTDSAEKFIWWNNLPGWKDREKVIRGINYLYKGTASDNALARREFEELVELLRLRIGSISFEVRPSLPKSQRSERPSSLRGRLNLAIRMGLARWCWVTSVSPKAVTRRRSPCLNAPQPFVQVVPWRTLCMAGYYSIPDNPSQPSSR